MYKSKYEIIATGLTMGVVHVLTGPDHLSALSTLSSTAKSSFHCFSLGVQWGMGHSIGLVTVASILIAASHSGDEKIGIPDHLRRIFEGCVGVFMVGLGLWGYYQAYNKEKERVESSKNVYVDEVTQTDGLELETDGDGDVRISASVTPLELEGQQDKDDPTFSHPRSCKESCIDIFCEFNTKKFLALGLGIVHGIAGPGGVLGVLPAIQLRELSLAFLYLGSFSAMSILCMGMYATCYGIFSYKISKNGKFEFHVCMFSASLSLIVGFIWLFMVASGKLAD